MPGLPSRLFKLLAPPLLALYAVDRGITHLEAKYPPRPEETTSLALRTPKKHTQICRHIDIYSTSIPLTHLLHRIPHSKEPTTPTPTTTTTTTTHLHPTQQDLHSAWSHSVLNSIILRTEASLVGLLTRLKFEPGDLGDSEDGFSPNKKTGCPRKLMNGVMTIERAPNAAGNESQQYGLLLSWQLAPEPRLFFEKIARWGYPWRLMSGGRHEIGVSEPFWDNGDGEGMMVEVRFASAHDYEFVPEEGGVERQKVIPAWSARLHRAFAMVILDMAVRELRWEAERREKGL